MKTVSTTKNKLEKTESAVSSSRGCTEIRFEPKWRFSPRIRIIETWVHFQQFHCTNKKIHNV
jgi:hypothetical protein